MPAIVETYAAGERPRTARTIARRQALRHDLSVGQTARAKPPRDMSWRAALIIVALHTIAIFSAMRWEGFYSWLW